MEKPTFDVNTLGNLEVFIPMLLKKKTGRKMVIAPNVQDYLVAGIVGLIPVLRISLYLVIRDCVAAPPAGFLFLISLNCGQFVSYLFSGALFSQSESFECFLF